MSLTWSAHVLMRGNFMPDMDKQEIVHILEEIGYFA